MKKEYLGDGVYVEFDGVMLKLTAEDGIRATNTIYLEFEVMFALTLYFKRLQEEITNVAKNGPQLD